MIRSHLQVSKYYCDQIQTLIMSPRTKDGSTCSNSVEVRLPHLHYDKSKIFQIPLPPIFL
jgi:hypothetical protein